MNYKTKETMDYFSLLAGHGGNTLKQYPYDELFGHNDKQQENHRCGYSLDEYDQLTGLKMKDFWLKDVDRIIVWLKTFTRMRRLDLQLNDLIEISPLKELSHIKTLTYINLSYNDIKDLTPLIHLKSLEIIDIRANMVWRNVDYLNSGNLPNLKKVLK